MTKTEAIEVIKKLIKDGEAYRSTHQTGEKMERQIEAFKVAIDSITPENERIKVSDKERSLISKAINALNQLERSGLTDRFEKEILGIDEMSVIPDALEELKDWERNSVTLIPDLTSK